MLNSIRNAMKTTVTLLLLREKKFDGHMDYSIIDYLRLLS